MVTRRMICNACVMLALTMVNVGSAAAQSVATVPVPQDEPVATLPSASNETPPTIAAPPPPSEPAPVIAVPPPPSDAPPTIPVPPPSSEPAPTVPPPPPSHAAEPIVPLPRTPRSPVVWRTQFVTGVSVADDDSAFIYGFAGHLRAHWFVIGGGLTLDRLDADNHIWTLQGDMGVGASIVDGVTLDLLGSLGVHDYRDPHPTIGSSTFDGPAADATLGFYGARVGLHYVFEVVSTGRAVRPTLGFIGSLERDFAPVMKDYLGDCTSPDCGLPSETLTIGGTRFTMLFSGGVTLDL